MNRPRTPEHFPKMKHRAAGRTIRRQAVAAAPETLSVFSVLADAAGKALGNLGKAFGNVLAAFMPPPVQSGFVLMGGPPMAPLSMMVSYQEQAETNAMRTRSYDLAVQRGHIRRIP